MGEIFPNIDVENIAESLKGIWRNPARDTKMAIQIYATPNRVENASKYS
jgi:hypothetical protein